MVKSTYFCDLCKKESGELSNISITIEPNAELQRKYYHSSIKVSNDVCEECLYSMGFPKKNSRIGLFCVESDMRSGFTKILQFVMGK